MREVSGVIRNLSDILSEEYISSFFQRIKDPKKEFEKKKSEKGQQGGYGEFFNKNKKMM